MERDRTSFQVGWAFLKAFFDNCQRLSSLSQIEIRTLVHCLICFAFISPVMAAERIPNPDLGVLMNSPGYPLSREIPEAEKYSYDILKRLLKDEAAASKFHWVIQIYSSPHPMTATELESPESDTSEYKQTKELYRFNDDLPIAKIQVSTALFDLVKTESQFAFILGNEIRHHIEGHTKTANGSPLQQWNSRQSNEAVADKGSMEYMRRHFRIEEAPTALNLLLEYQLEHEAKDEDRSTESLFNKVTGALTEDHHNPGIRLAMLRNHFRDIVQQDPDSSNIESLPLPKAILSLSRYKSINLPIATKVEMIKLLNGAQDTNIDLSSFFEVFEKFFSKNKSFWSFSNANDYFESWLEELNSSVSDAHRKAEILLAFLLSTREGWPPAKIKFFGEMSPETKLKIHSVLMGLSKDQNPSWTSLNIKTSSGVNRLSEVHKEISWNRGLQNIFDGLAVQHSGWQNFIEQMNSQYSKTAYNKETERWPHNFKPVSLWEQSFARHLMRSFDFAIMGSSNLGAFSINKAVPMLRDFYNPALRPFFMDLLTKEEFSSLESKAFQVVNNQYQLAKDKSSSSSERLTYLANWCNRASISFKKMWTYDFEHFLSELEKIGLGSRISVLQHYMPKETFTSLNLLLLEKVVAHTSISSDRRLQLIVTLTELADDKNFVETLLRDNPNFKMSFQNLFRSVTHPLKIIWNASESTAQSRQTLLTKLKTMNFFRELGLLKDKFGLTKNREIFDDIISSMEILAAKNKANDGILLKGDLADFLLDWTLRIAENPQITDKRPMNILERTLAVTSKNYILPVELMERTSALVQLHLNTLKPLSRLEVLKKPWVRRSLNRALFEKYFVDGFSDAVKANRKPTELWTELSIAFDFNKNAELGQDLRQKIAKKISIQPLETGNFKVTSQSDTALASQFSTHLRLWSALIATIHAQNFQGQIQGIEYFMGRSSKMPGYFMDLHLHDQGTFNIRQKVEELRTTLAQQNKSARTFFVQSLLEGPKAQLMKLPNREAVANYLSDFVEPDKREIVKDMAVSTLESMKETAPLLMSRILSQKKLNESSMVAIFLDYFGVPTTKLGQYLGFITGFKKYAEHLAVYQDSAPVPGYFSLMQYLKKASGNKIDLSKIRIIRLIGAGTVNLAFEYEDLATNEVRVFSIPRENINNVTQSNFAEFRQLSQSLAKRSTAKKDYNFILGLLELTQESVKLEFDRVATAERMRDARQKYDGTQLNGWSFKTVSVLNEAAGAIFMTKANGITARKLWESDPQQYKQIMKNLYDFEYQHLKKVISGQSGSLFLFQTNPDLHDGNVLVDVSKKSITVIDFGQALRMNRAEVDLGLDLISLVAGLKMKSESHKFVQQWLTNHGQPTTYSEEALDEILKREEPVDRLIRLVAYMAQRKSSLPLASVHLALEVNRISKLGEKVGRHPTIQMGFQLFMREARQLFSPAKSTGNSCKRLFLRD